MSRSTDDRDDADRRREESPSDGDGRQGPYGEAIAAWFAASTLRLGLALVGFVVLVFALGQAAGVDMFGLIADALSTEAGRWLTVALFGLLLIVIALYSFKTPSW